MKEKIGNRDIVNTAKAVVDYFKDHQDIDLDYSLASLGRVDPILRELQYSSERDKTACSIGCYVGEVLARNGGGDWVEGKKLFREHFGAEWVVVLPGGIAVNPVKRCTEISRGFTDQSIEAWAKMLLDANGQYRFHPNLGAILCYSE